MTAIIANLIRANLESVALRMKAAVAQRPVAQQQAVTLIAVSKTQPVETIRAAYAAGQRQFGENYVQEALAKIEALTDLPLEWHFIGPIQSNKARLIAEHFAWVHGVDRLKIAETLSRHRPSHLPPLNMCVQVNISGEASKGGIYPDALIPFLQSILPLPNLRLRGLMAIIENNPNSAVQRAQFAALRQLAESAIAAGIKIDTLSMGMTQDFEIAIAEGATMVRIGTAIFGARQLDH